MYPLLSLPVTIYLIHRSYTRQSLTPLGILTATLTALLHSAHSSPLPFTLLVVFFLAGTTATKLNHDVKSRYTLSSVGSVESVGGGGGAGRTHVQVLANSGVASLLVLVHVLRGGAIDLWGKGKGECIPTTGSTEGLILAGIVANYAAVAADTFSSELGILAQRMPRLITRPWVKVPRGTNGGVTIMGLGAGVLGASIVAVASVLVMPFCGGGRAAGLGPVGRVLMAGEKEEAYRGWTVTDKLIWVLAVTVWGALGSVLDSLLGAVLQASVVDRRTGKIVEGSGGEKVLVSGGKGRDAKRGIVHAERDKDEALRKRNGADRDEKATPAAREESRRVLVGMDWLDNNQINLLMAACMSAGGVGVASWYWGIPLSSIIIFR
jgi:uncharacterized membrane protein